MWQPGRSALLTLVNPLVPKPGFGFGLGVLWVHSGLPVCSCHTPGLPLEGGGFVLICPLASCQKRPVPSCQGGRPSGNHPVQGAPGFSDLSLRLSALSGSVLFFQAPRPPQPDPKTETQHQCSDPHTLPPVEGPPATGPPGVASGTCKSLLVSSLVSGL